MRSFFLTAILIISFSSVAQIKRTFISFGLDYREFPIDVEDVPRGGYHSKGGFYGERFWRTASILSRFGLSISRRWQFSLASYVRYNHMNWLEGKSYYSPESFKRSEKKNFKYDLFIDAEKKLNLKKNREHYLTVLAGIGFTNINTAYDVTYRYTLPGGGVFDSSHYKGTISHFTPRVSVGYQYKEIKFSFDTYIIEGADRTNLTALWMGASVSYEIWFKKRKK